MSDKKPPKELSPMSARQIAIGIINKQMNQKRLNEIILRDDIEQALIDFAASETRELVEALEKVRYERQPLFSMSSGKDTYLSPAHAKLIEDALTNHRKKYPKEKHES